MPILKKAYAVTQRINGIEEIKSISRFTLLLMQPSIRYRGQIKSINKRKSHRSGNDHTVKTQMIVSWGDLIIHKTKHTRGH
ncbi:MAG: hypothetical protein QW292_11175 [Candidatus Parvarchaeota archaeon]